MTTHERPPRQAVSSPIVSSASLVLQTAPSRLDHLHGEAEPGSLGGDDLLELLRQLEIVQGQGSEECS